MRRLGIEIDRDREGKARERMITITRQEDGKVGKFASASSALSATSAKPISNALKNKENKLADKADKADANMQTSLFTSSATSSATRSGLQTAVRHDGRQVPRPSSLSRWKRTDDDEYE